MDTMINSSYIMVMWYQCVPISLFIIVGYNLKFLIFLFAAALFCGRWGILGLWYGCDGDGTHQLIIIAYLVSTLEVLSTKYAA